MSDKYGEVSRQFAETFREEKYRDTMVRIGPGAAGKVAGAAATALTGSHNAGSMVSRGVSHAVKRDEELAHEIGAEVSGFAVEVAVGVVSVAAAVTAPIWVPLVWLKNKLDD